MSHVTLINESRHVHKGVMGHPRRSHNTRTNEPRHDQEGDMSRSCMSHVTESCHTNTWVMLGVKSHSFVSQSYESRHRVMSHSYMSHVIWVMSRAWRGHITLIKGSRHGVMSHSHVSHVIWVMSRRAREWASSCVNESCHTHTWVTSYDLCHISHVMESCHESCQTHTWFM